MGTTEAITEQAGRDRVARDATRELLAERVARGVALLDREMPDWWRGDREPEPINLDLFDMGASDWCVFGQLEDPGAECAYERMAERMFGLIRGEMSTDYGVYSRTSWHYPILTEMWREVIEKRRANA